MSTMTDPLRVGALFAGYGGVELALRTVLPVELVWVSQWEPPTKSEPNPAQGPSRVLAHHWPDVPNHGDITAIDWSQVAPVDVLTGGFPCQDVSPAGKRAGLIRGETRSGLWSYMHAAIDALRPRLVVIENVRGLLSAKADSDVEFCPWCMGGPGDGEPALLALGAVLGDLADIGYDAAWVGLRAADVGACHGRFRVFVLAWPADDTSVLSVLPADDTSVLLPTPVASLSIEAQRMLLPTPTASDRNGAGAHGDGGADLRTTVQALLDEEEALRATAADEVEHLLPTPTAHDSKSTGPSQAARRSPGLDAVEHLLPTPTPTNAHGNAENNRGDRLLPGVVQDMLLPTPVTQPTTGNGHARNLGAEVADLLPTPSVADTQGGRKTRSGARSDEMLLNGLAAEPGRFGRYSATIARAEVMAGRPAPDPTEPTGKGGAQRLSPRFVEWMQGLPDGHVTDPAIWEGWTPSRARNAQLKMLGNGVVPQQCAAGLRWLIAVRNAAMTGETAVAA